MEQTEYKIPSFLVSALPVMLHCTLKQNNSSLKELVTSLRLPNPFKQSMQQRVNIVPFTFGNKIFTD